MPLSLSEAQPSLHMIHKAPNKIIFFRTYDVILADWNTMVPFVLDISGMAVGFVPIPMLASSFLLILVIRRFQLVAKSPY